MNHSNPSGLIMALLLAAGFFILSGCDSGEKAVDKVTGKQDVEQYHKMKKDIGKIAEEQAKKHNDALKATEGK